MVESALRLTSPVTPKAGPAEEIIQSRLVITRRWGYLLFVDTRAETKQKNVSGFELGPPGRQQGNIGKQGGASSQEWVSGVTGAFTNHFTFGFGHCGLPGGMAG